MSIAPFIKSPFSDFSGNIANHQNFGRCRDIEMRALNCLEAYGLEKGFKKCGDIIDDFKECFTRTKQLKRLHEMKRERMNQNTYAPPPREDSFIQG